MQPSQSSNDETKPPKYLAFISYSHADARASQWLHRALETYALPQRLVGSETIHGVVPPRIYPVFRDRDELASSSELSDTLRLALEQSFFLVVVCSPSAAASRWVNEEIRLFKAMGRERRVIALIVDGEPNVDDANACFPPALRHVVGPDGELTGQRTEPIAADLRRGGDGRNAALLKVVAGIAGVSYDDLRQRDRARRRVRRLWAGAATVVGIGLLAIGLHRYDIERRKSDYEERGRKELIAQQPARAAVYLSEAYALGNESSDLRFMLWQAMLDVETFVASAQWPGQKVFGAAFTPDGSRLLVAQSKDPAGVATMIRALDPATLREITSFETEMPIGRLDFDPATGALLFAARGRFGMLDPATGKVRWSIPVSTNASERPQFTRTGHRAVVTAANSALVIDLDTGAVLRRIAQAADLLVPALSANGEWLLLANGRYQSGGKFYSNHVVLWRVADGARQRSFDSTADLFDWRFATSGSRFLLAERSGSVVVYDPDSREPVSRFRHPQGLWTTQWSPDARWIATAGLNGSVYLWNADDGQVRSALHGHTTGARTVRFLGGSDRLVTTSSDGTMRVWDGTVGKSLAVFDAQHGLYPDAAVSGDENRVLSFARGDETVKLWDTQKVKPLRRFQIAPEGMPIDWLNVSRDGRRLTGTPQATEAYAWDALTGARLVKVPLVELPPASGAGDMVLLSRDGERIMSGRGVWEVTTGRKLIEFPVEPPAISQTTNDWDLDGKQAAYLANDGRVTVYDVVEGKVLSTFQAERDGSLSFAPEGRLIATMSADGVAVFDATTGRVVAQIRSPDGSSQVPLFAADGLHLLSYAPQGSSGQLIDLGTNHVIATIDATGANWLPICDRRLLLLLVPTSRDAQIYDLVSGQRVVTLRGRTFGFNAATCDFASGRIATANTDGMTRIWRLADGVLLAEIATHVIASDGAYYADGGKRLVTSGYDGTVAIWEIGEERRSPAEVRRSVACRVPWRIEERELVQVPVDAASCR